MAKNRYVGDYPVIGIRPIVDGRRGPLMLRESLEPIVWAMAEAAKGCTCPPEFPVCVCGKKPLVKLISRKPITATV